MRKEDLHHAINHTYLEYNQTYRFVFQTLSTVQIEMLFVYW